MAIINEINTSALPKDLRFDADYHIGPGSTDRKTLTKTGIPFGDVFSRIIHPGEFTRSYQERGHVFLRAQNVRTGWIDASVLVYVSDQVCAELTEAAASENELLIVRTGANLGDVARVGKQFDGALVSSHTLRLVPKPGAPSYALAAFLASDLGQRILLSVKNGSAQGQINGASLETLYLPKLTHLESKCRTALDEAQRLNALALTAYPETEVELLDRLGWSELETQPRELTYSTDFSKLALAGRSDAEFFQPQFDRLVALLQKRGSHTLKEVVTFCARGVQPEYNDDGEVTVVNSKHLGPTQLDFSDREAASRKFFNRPDVKDAHLHRNDVLVYATGAYIGRTNVYLCDAPAIASNHVTIVRPDSAICHPVYLALFLNSPAGLLQAYRYATGSAQRELYPPHIRQFLVFLPRTKSGKIDIAWQEGLAAKVEAATRAREEAKSKLAEAKCLVEDALADL